MVHKKELLFVFCVGAVGYCLLEVLWRGTTHWTMALAGGICFAGIHLTNIYASSLSLWRKCLVGAALITVVELFTGIVVNLWLHWQVWDYSGQWLNFFGQVCPLFSFFWLALTLPLLFFSSRINRIFWSFSPHQKASHPKKP